MRKVRLTGASLAATCVGLKKKTRLFRKQCDQITRDAKADKAGNNDSDTFMTSFHWHSLLILKEKQNSMCSCCCCCRALSCAVSS